MFDLKGEYSSAKVFTDLADDKTIGQVLGFLNSPITENQRVRIMPDCHAGAGCVIGTTMTIGDKLCPNVVGVDIGCGMLVVELKNEKLDLNKADDACHLIPSGHDTWEDKGITTSDFWQEWLKEDADSFISRLKCKDYLKSISRLENSLGSLGGGNHFIEFNKDDEGNLYLVIHSGSRNLGKQVAEYYQELAFQDMNDFRGEMNKVIDDLKAQGKYKEIQKAIEDMKASAPKYSKETAYLKGEHLNDYLHDMRLCQEFASASRKVMANEILKYIFGIDKFYNHYTWFETVHNYINFNDHILRKGAVSANKNEKLIIPMNMRDGSLICVGKGNHDWNYSAPHGAGRLMSRGEAKEKISLEEYERSMEGIFSTSVNTSTIDEAPMVYKPMDSIIQNIQDTVEIIKIIKPIYNFKASD